MRVTRRSLLMGVASVAISQYLAGCRSGSNTTLQIRALNGTIPAQMLGRFRTHLQRLGSLSEETQSTTLVQITPEARLDRLFMGLQALQQAAQNPRASSSTGRVWPFSRSQPIPHLVTLGDYWLAPAIRQGLIQPLDPTQWQHWQQLPSRWQTLVRRNQDGSANPSGDVWGAPYSWGTTVIAYRADLFAAQGWNPITDWSDLWRPELQHHISLLDHPREVIGLTLKSLGQSYNQTNLSAVSELKPALEALHRQVKFYSSTHYLQPFILGDTSVVVGWSTDILPLLRADRAAYAPNKRRYAAIIPASGTALWANLWVTPSSPAVMQGNSETSPLDSSLDWSRLSQVASQWIDFCWQPDIVPQLSLLSGQASPLLSTLDAAALPPELKADSLLLPDPTILDRSEFLLPLDQATTDDYRQVWQAMRQVTLS